MNLKMFFSINYLQILNSIIGFFAVDMVNMLRREKLPLKKLLHDIAMLQHGFCSPKNIFSGDYLVPRFSKTFLSHGLFIRPQPN